MSARSAAHKARAAAEGAVAAIAGAVLWVRAQVLSERDRWVLWLPVALGAGVALYFQLPFVVPFWAALAVAAIAALVIVWRASVGPGWVLALSAALLLLAAGMALGDGRTGRLAAPMLADEHGPAWIEARITQVEANEEGYRRITLAPRGIEDLAPEYLPHRIRVTVRQQGDDVLPGQQVEFLGMLLPPSGPAAPGAFDFARAAYFDRLGGVGYSLSAPAASERQTEAGLSDQVQNVIANLRHGMTSRIRAALPARSGGVAAALITGDRSGIAEDDLAAMRGAGLAHLIAISGLHMALVGGLLFLSVRLILVLREEWALTRPIKKWAAVIALTGAFGYLIISGGSVSTQRAFIMISIAFIAVLADRPVLTMRTVAVAALAILVLAPESVTQVSFQMSFAAVIALIALSEWLAPRLAGGAFAADRSWPRRLGVYFVGLSVTSLIAGLTIAPSAAYHFNRFSNYEVAANLIAMPLMAFWIMPWGIVGVLLMPFGLEGLALRPMGWGIDAILWTAHSVSGWPGAEVAVGAVAPWVLAVIALGGAWIAVWRRPWRWAGLALIAAGLLSFPLARGPDVLIQAEGESLAVRGVPGELEMLFPCRAQYEQEQWLRRDGDTRSLSDAGGDFPCDAVGCIVDLPDGETLAYTLEPQALIDDCRRADILVTPMPVRIHCPNPHTIIDYYALRRGGAHSITFVEGAPIIARAENTRRGRPWSHAGQDQ